MSDQEKTRYFEYMRPRYSNPSFASTNVGASLGMSYVRQFPVARPIIKSFKVETKQPQLPTPKVQAMFEEPKPQSRFRRSKSNLSNYGTSSLRSLPKFCNQRDIYQKQEKKYNIITIQPKEYNETIKKYPKFRLEHIDQNYYKKLKLQEEYTQNYNKTHAKRTTHNFINPQTVKAQIPTKPQHPTPTESSQTGRVQGQKHFRAKMLNNIDELQGVL